MITVNTQTTSGKVNLNQPYVVRQPQFDGSKVEVFDGMSSFKGEELNEEDSNLFGCDKACRTAKKENRKAKKAAKTAQKIADAKLTEATAGAVSQSQASSQEAMGTGTIIALAVFGLLIVGGVLFVMIKKRKAAALAAASAPKV